MWLLEAKSKNREPERQDRQLTQKNPPPLQLKEKKVIYEPSLPGPRLV